MRLSPNFTLAEFTKSGKADELKLNNTPDEKITAQLIKTAEAMEVVRSLLGKPININSGYRSPRVNSAVGGSRTSDHMTGHAVDFVCPSFGSPLDICIAIVKSDIQFSQLIYEGTWVHISFKENKTRQVMTRKIIGGKVKYLPGIVE